MLGCSWQTSRFVVNMHRLAGIALPVHLCSLPWILSGPGLDASMRLRLRIPPTERIASAVPSDFRTGTPYHAARGDAAQGELLGPDHHYRIVVVRRRRWPHRSTPALPWRVPVGMVPRQVRLPDATCQLVCQLSSNATLSLPLSSHVLQERQNICTISIQGTVASCDHCIETLARPAYNSMSRVCCRPVQPKVASRLHSLLVLLLVNIGAGACVSLAYAMSAEAQVTGDEGYMPWQVRGLAQAFVGRHRMCSLQQRTACDSASSRPCLSDALLRLSTRCLSPTPP